MNIQVYATAVEIDLQTKTVNLSGVDLADLLADINTQEVLDALQANDQFSTMHDWFIQAMKPDEE